MRVLVLHGPNLNLLGSREPAVYGATTLAEIDAALARRAAEAGVQLSSFQSNHEGALVDYLQGCRDRVDAVLLNAAAYTHTSVALRDAIAAVRPPLIVVEVHLTVPESREPFRRENLLSGVVDGRIAGFGRLSYVLALRGASTLIASRGNG